MIPFASQRAEGQDLATHLQNAEDNEYLEVADVRGALADDLHGAFAEWEAQAAAMTKCKNYLYSLSINPDHRQAPMPRELYDDYLNRVEESLGLAGQPRAVVFHIKNGREHAHAVWSRVDVQDMKAIHMAFDHEKLMTVTREFAREHDIQLAPGYQRLKERKRQTYRQLSLYEKVQKDESGMTREERQQVITELWQRRDTPASFIQSLEYHGYILAQGKRPFVLVDIHGQTNSLPKLIDDRAANTRAIRDFLKDAGKSENLPTVDEAKVLAARHYQALKEHKQAEDRADKLDALKRRQATRREAFEAAAQAKKGKQDQERRSQSETQMAERQVHQNRHDLRTKAIQDQRLASKPEGLAGLLAKASGYAFVQDKLRLLADRKRELSFQNERQGIKDRQFEQAEDLRRQHSMQLLDLERKRRALAQTEVRERQSLEKTFLREDRTRARGSQTQGPNMGLHLTPPGRRAAPHKVVNRHKNELSRKLEMAKTRTEQRTETSNPELEPEFTRSAAGETAVGLADENGGPATKVTRTSKRVFKRSSNQKDTDRER